MGAVSRIQPDTGVAVAARDHSVCRPFPKGCSERGHGWRSRVWTANGRAGQGPYGRGYRSGIAAWSRVATPGSSRMTVGPRATGAGRARAGHTGRPAAALPETPVSGGPIPPHFGARSRPGCPPDPRIIVQEALLAIRKGDRSRPSLADCQAPQFRVLALSATASARTRIASIPCWADTRGSTMERPYRTGRSGGMFLLHDGREVRPVLDLESPDIADGFPEPGNA